MYTTAVAVAGQARREARVAATRNSSTPNAAT